MSSRRFWTGKSRMSSSKASILLTDAPVSAAETGMGWGGCSSMGVVAILEVRWRIPYNLASGLFGPMEGTSVVLEFGTKGESALYFRALGDSRGEGGSTCTDLGRLWFLFFCGVLGRDPLALILSRDARERSNGISSSESPNSSNSWEISTSKIASYKSCEFVPTTASRKGMCLIERGRLL